MSTFTEIIANIRTDLNDAGITFYTDAEITDSLQDAYDDIAFHSNCIIKKTTLSFQSNLNYYDFKTDLSVTDFMAVTAIFNNNTNLWLLDDRALKDFDLMRTDWENWTGTPQWWAPVNFRYTALVPKYVTGTGTFDLYYWATAPTVVTSDTPLIATDMQALLEYFVVADLLEGAIEFKKAKNFWDLYYSDLAEYATRTKNLAKSDLLMLA